VSSRPDLRRRKSMDKSSPLSPAPMGHRSLSDHTWAN
jgi:hypothetical protein